MFHTMAIAITDKTYPIAVACLPGEFVTVPRSAAYGCFLVINEIQPRDIPLERSPITVLENSWLTREDFEDRYVWTAVPRMNTFTIVALRD